MFPNLILVSTLWSTMVCRAPYWRYWWYNWWTTNYDLHCSTNFSSNSCSCWVDNCVSNIGGCYSALLQAQKEEEAIQSVSFVLCIVMMAVMIMLLCYTLSLTLWYLSSQSSAWNGTADNQSQCTWVHCEGSHRIHNVIFSAIVYK